MAIYKSNVPTGRPPEPVVGSEDFRWRTVTNLAEIVAEQTGVDLETATKAANEYFRQADLWGFWADMALGQAVRRVAQ